MTDYPRDFSEDFNYALWTNDTEITLTNVPWNNDYRDVVRFANQAALDTYIDTRTSTRAELQNLKYASLNEPIKIRTPFAAASKFNYVRARNRRQSALLGDEDTTFYYFITSVRFEAGNTTEITVQLDIWSTYIHKVQIGACYVERGHIGIANENNFSNYGRDYLTIPEGLDVGGEYVTKVVKREKLIDGNTFNVLAVSSIDLSANPWNGNEPVLKTAPGSRFGQMPSGSSYYVWEDIGAFEAFVRGYATSPHVTQGILSITAIPQLTRYYQSAEMAFDNASDLYRGIDASGWGYAADKRHDMFPDWRNSPDIVNAIPVRYRHLKKFFTYPYMIIEMTTLTGTPVILKPEAWDNPDAKVMEQAALTPPNQRVQFFPIAYNGVEYHDLGDGSVWGGDAQDISTMITNFPSFALINNAALGYLSSNFHSNAFQSGAADWSQQKALGANQLSYDQSTNAMSLANELNNLGTATDAAQTALGNRTAWANYGVDAVAGVANAGVGVAGSLLSGNIGSAVTAGAGAAINAAAGAASTAINVDAANQSLGLRTSMANQSVSAQTKSGEYVRDTNKDLSDWAAKGDYAQAIAGQNAKLQDAKMIQPTTSGQVGGEMMNILHDQFGLYLRFKMLDGAAYRRIGEYWLRYGYQVQQFVRNIPADFMVMNKFTYWKMSETYIHSAPIPETFKQAIRGIFEKGVTIWADPADLGNPAFDMATNTPKTGITL